MCRNMALKHEGEVVAFDAFAPAYQAIEDSGAERAENLAGLAARADIVFLSLPGGEQSYNFV